MYPSPELLGHDSLDIEPSLIPSLLSEEEVAALVRVYLDNMRNNYEVRLKIFQLHSAYFLSISTSYTIVIRYT